MFYSHSEYFCVDEVCRDGDDSSSNHVCRRINNCPIVIAGIQNNISPQICSFIGSSPVVCCPPSPDQTNPPVLPIVPKPPSVTQPSNRPKPPSQPNPPGPPSQQKPISRPTFNIDTNTPPNKPPVKPKPPKVVKTYSATESNTEYSIN